MSLTGSGSIPNTTPITINSGAAIDVSAGSGTLTLGATQTLKGNNTFNINGNLTSLGGTTYSSGPTGVVVGKLQTGVTTVTAIPTGAATTVGTLSTGTGAINYQLDNGSAYRYGVIQFTNTGSAVTYQDDYTETGTSLGGNIYINNTGTFSCSVTTAATLKYNLTQYIS